MKRRRRGTRREEGKNLEETEERKLKRWRTESRRLKNIM